MYVLGVNVAERPSACLIASDGRAVATLEPPDAPTARSVVAPPPPPCHMPARAIASCLTSLGIGIDDLGIVVLCGGVVHDGGSGPRNLRVEDCARQLPWSPRTHLHTIDHHLAHACSAFYPSGFDRAAVLVVDRGGGIEPPEARGPGAARLRASAYLTEGGPLRRVLTVSDREGALRGGANSVGAMLELFAALSSHGDVGGLLDLATRGGDRLRHELARYCELTRDGYQLSSLVQLEDQAPPPGASVHQRDLPVCLAAPGCADTAWAVDDLLQRTVKHLAVQLVERTGARKLCLAGDAAVHGLARLTRSTDPWVDQIYAPPAPGEAGTAVGAALFGWYELLGTPPPCELETAFSGRIYGDDEVRAALGGPGAGAPAGPRRFDRALAELADRLAGGALVAWFDGGAGLGDALERRCVLASPRALAVSCRLPPSLCRPSYRAPTALVLAEEADDYFELSEPSPFAHRVARVRPEHTAAVPLVVRSDGTSRVQTIDRWRAPRLHDLLAGFRRRGGLPVLAAMPMCPSGGASVETPHEAVQLWSRAGLDAIYLQGQLRVCSSETRPLHDES